MLEIIGFIVLVIISIVIGISLYNLTIIIFRMGGAQLIKY